MYTNPEFWTALEQLVTESEILIDRPKNSAHPKYPHCIYPVDYGYLKNTASMDGDGIDVWVGTAEKKVTAILCTIDLTKKDSEIKILLGCAEEEIHRIYEFHNDSAYMKGILLRR